MIELSSSSWVSTCACGMMVIFFSTPTHGVHAFLNEIDLCSADARIFPCEDNLWSPWFRIIVERFAREWWLNLNDAIKTNKYMDTVNIHRFDPPSKYRGGAGVTGLLEEGEKAAVIDK